MRKLSGTLLVLALVLSFSLVATAPVAAATHNVGPGDSIQAAIDDADPGDTIIVAAGTYVEQLTIDKNLIILGVDNPRIEAPASAARTARTISGSGTRVLDWVVLFEDVEEFTFDGFVVDGKEDGTSVRFVGILVGNSEGTINTNEVINVRGPEGGTGGIVIYGGQSVVDIVGNEVRDFRKNGITAISDATASIVGNTVVGDGPIDTIAQNGIQIGFGATGEIIGNKVSAIFYDADGWSSCGILVIKADDVLVEGNTVYDCQSGISLSPQDWETMNNIIVRGNVVRDCESAIYNGWQGFFTGDRLIEDNELYDNYRGISLYDAEGWLVKGNTVDGSTTRGIGILGACSDNTVEANTLTSNAVGVLVGNDGYGDPAGTVVRFNNIFGNTDFGIEVLDVGNPNVVQATHNWWGDASGPSGEGPGSGDSVTTNVDFEPWLGAAMTGQPTGCTADTGTGQDAEAETNNVSAQATGGDSTTTVTVAEYVGEPTGVDPGLQAGAFFFDVHVGGAEPDTLVITVGCPAGECSGMILKWFDGVEWLEVSPVSYTNGEVVAELNNVDSSPLISELTGTPFGLGGPPLLPAAITVGWDGSSINKATVMAPWVALFALIAGATLVAVRRRGARI